MTASVSPSVAGWRVGRFGVWRAVIAMPAMLGSMLLLLVVFGWAGRWEPVVVLTWLACGAGVCTRVGERIAVRVGCRFGRPTHQHRTLLEPVWRAALVRCGLSGEDLDLYVRPGRSRMRTGHPLARELNRRIFSPLHLDHTSFPVGNAPLTGYYAHGYITTEVNPTADGQPLDVTPTTPPTPGPPGPSSRLPPT